ncbi:MAG TPA: protein TolQ, partial [Methylibium sp.]
MSQDLNIINLVLHASFIVQIVMAGLLITSLVSWAVIFGKLFGLRRVRGNNEEFEREFWSGRQLQELYSDAAKVASDNQRAAPMERIFASGMREFFKLRERRVNEA